MTAAARPCECGCGRPTQPYSRSCPARGQVAGEPARFIRGHAGGQAASKRWKANTRATVVRAELVRERYAEQLQFASELLIGAVHDEGSVAVLAAYAGALAIPAPPGVDPAVALCTVLAAQVDPDAPRSERLGWTEPWGGAA